MTELPKRRRGRPTKAEQAERQALIDAGNKRNFDITAAFTELYKPHRVKCYHGGRGGAKSWAIADALLIQAWQKPLRILCTREYQNTIRESSHQLLRDRIAALQFQGEYTVLESEIRGSNGSLFIFKGLKHDPEGIKSTEGLDIAWLEEGQTTSEKSWNILTPTLRKTGSEIWVSMNVRNKEDYLYKHMVLNPPKYAYVKKVGWQDNPWFPEVLQQEMAAMKEADYEKYLHIWEGELLAFADGAYYKKELVSLREAGQITKVPYDPVLPVHTVWDLGVGDSTAIIFAQLGPNKEIRVIDAYEMSGEGLPHYAKALQQKPYVYGLHFAPHDIRVRELGSGKSRLEQAAALGINFEIVRNIPIDDGIAAARSTLPLCWFDEKKTERLIECLSNYHREWDIDRKDWKVRPNHDWSSHMADAFRYLAVGLKPKPIYKEPPRLPHSSEAGAWMN